MSLADIDYESEGFRKLIKDNIFRVLEDSIIITNLEGKIMYWNKGAETIFGYTEHEALGQTPAFIFSDMSEKMLKVDVEKIINGENYKGEWKGKRKDGNPVWVNVKMTAMRDYDGKMTGFISISQDITEQKQTVKELIQSETKYQTIFENSGEGFFLLKDVFIDVNKKVCELFGFKKNDIIGKSPLDFSPKKQADGSLSKDKAKYYIKKALKEGHTAFYWQHLSKSKKIIEARISLNRVRIKGESFLIAIMQDMTEIFKYHKKLKAKTRELSLQNKKISKLNEELNASNNRLKLINNQIEMSERKFRAAFKTSPDAITIERLSDSLYAEINEGFTHLTGYTEDDIRAKTSAEFCVWVKNSDHEELVKRLAQNEYVSNLETQFRRKDHSIVTVLISASIIEINSEKQILSIIRDITERKEYEEKLKEATRKAEESDMLKSAFLANMSHEIRTPMNAILGFGQLLREKQFDREKQNKFLDIVVVRSKNLLQIINDIIDISKIEANQLKIEKHEFSLDKMLYELFSIFEAEIATANKEDLKIEFKAELYKEASYIESDKVRLRQILTNLISNAIKFTDKGKIKFGYKIEKEMLQFFVKDTGIGIPKEALGHIFERFRQADGSNTREFGGTGLGLSISKQLVEMMGGNIWVESEVDKGSKFYFTIPFKPVSKNNELQKNKQESIPDLSDHCFLLVEDDAVSMTYLEEILQPTKVKIVKAFDGEQALEKFKSEKVDLILMDIHLPKMSGNEATREIKKINKSVPVIAQSAFAMPNDKKESFTYGCDDYITKPIDTRLLFSTIKKFLT